MEKKPKPSTAKEPTSNNSNHRSRGCCVVAVNDLDVLLGRGKRSYNHAGNLRFRELVVRRASDYKFCSSKLLRRQMAHDIIETVERSGGRFLKPRDHNKRNDGHLAGQWEIVSKSVATTKVKQALRDNGDVLMPSEKANSPLQLERPAQTQAAPLGSSLGSPAAGPPRASDAQQPTSNIPSTESNELFHRSSPRRVGSNTGRLAELDQQRELLNLLMTEQYTRQLSTANQLLLHQTHRNYLPSMTSNQALLYGVQQVLPPPRVIPNSLDELLLSSTILGMASQNHASLIDPPLRGRTFMESALPLPPFSATAPFSAEPSRGPNVHQHSNVSSILRGDPHHRRGDALSASSPAARDMQQNAPPKTTTDDTKQKPSKKPV